MTDPSDPETLLDSIASHIARLNDEETGLNAQIRRWESQLSSLGVGVEVWLSDDPLEVTYSRFFGADDHFKSQTEDIVMEEHHEQLGYAKPPGGDGWCFCVRNVTYRQDNKSEIQTGAPSPLLKASRTFRLAALDRVSKILARIEAQLSRAAQSLGRKEVPKE